MIVPIVGTLIVTYFVHAFHGERGIIALDASAEAGVARGTDASGVATRSVREDLERRTSLLRPERLDADMLDERARVILHLIRRDEIIIVDPLRTRDRCPS